MRRSLCIAVLLAATATASLGDVVAQTSADDSQRILDTRSYWRSFHVLRPARTSPRLWKTVALPAGGRRWADWDKRGRNIDELPVGLTYHYTFNGHWATSPILSLMNSLPPPENWFAADFDDSGWVRMRYPMMMNFAGDEGVETDIGLHGVASSCFRAVFHVENPAKVQRLTLRLAYRGGAVLWVNGREVGRGHLPDGPITADTVATEYDETDYALPPRDDLEPILSQSKRPDGTGHLKDFLAKFKDKPRAIADIGGPYEQGIRSIHHYFAAPITPDEYDALLKRRDRQLVVAIEPDMLRKGVNVLAIQTVRADLHPVVTMGERLGPAAHYGWAVMLKGLSWLHNCIVDVDLRVSPAEAVRAERRPEGVQVWVESANKRLFSDEFGPGDGTAGRVVRIVGARQGTYSGQVVVGASQELRGLSARAGDLAGPGGAAIPASAIAVRYMAPRPVRDISPLGFERNPQGDAANPMGSPDIWLALWRFGKRGPDGQLPFNRLGRVSADVRDVALQQVRFFDEIAPAPPAAVPADSCQPIWLSVKVPADTPAGLYAGKLTISAEGMPPEQVAVKLQVVDWKLPDPTAGEDFTTMVAMEQSPWGVAKAHKCEPWSDEHFGHIEKSLRRLAELGNDYFIIPVLVNSEFGNREDSSIIWVRGKDGKLTCDFARFDRYMDLVQKHMPRPRVVVFGLAHPTDNNLWVVPQVLLRDEATGKTGPVTLPMGQPNPFKDKRQFTDAEQAEAREFLRPFVEGVLARMAKRGLSESVFWGYLWDYTHPAERYGGVLAELAPNVKWARGCHGHGAANKLSEPFGFQASIVCLPQPVRRIADGPDKGKYEIFSHTGWANDALHLSLPRTQNAVLCVIGGAVPYYWRIYPELALCGGARGIARIGADYWEQTCYDGWRGGGQVGLAVTGLFWPGKDEANSSARFEILREGLQEAEARVILEKALAGPFGQTDAASAVRAMLANRITSTMHIMRSYYTARPGEQDFGWQQRSWDLYSAAAAAAGGQAPSDESKGAFFGSSPNSGE